MIDNPRARARLLAVAREHSLEDTAMSETATVQVAADVGNARTVVLVKSESGTAAVKLPTVKSTIGLTLPDRLGKDDFVIRRDRGGVHVPIALGWTALRYADGASAARGHADRYGAWTLDFILAAVARAARAQRVDAHLKVCVPAGDYDSVAPQVVKAMRGAHAFGAPEPTTVRFGRVDVVREGAIGLSVLRGRVDGNVIVIDGGGGTTHVALYRNGTLINVVTRPIGVQRVLDAANSEIARQLGRELTMLERYELEDALAAGAPYRIIVRGKEQRVDHFARSFLDETAGMLIADVKSIVPKWRNANTVHLVGGVAYTMGRHFAGQVEGEEGFPGLIVAQRPDEVNARSALAAFGGVAVESEEAA